MQRRPDLLLHRHSAWRSSNDFSSQMQASDAMNINNELQRLLEMMNDLVRSTKTL
jgi:hypothetical protein